MNYTIQTIPIAEVNHVQVLNFFHPYALSYLLGLSLLLFFAYLFGKYSKFFEYLQLPVLLIIIFRLASYTQGAYSLIPVNAFWMKGVVYTIYTTVVLYFGYQIAINWSKIKEFAKRFK